MQFYVVLILISVLLSAPYSFLYKKESALGEKSKNYRISLALFILGGILVFLSMALRYGVGTDYFFTYVPRFYQYMSSPDEAKSWEPIFKWLYLSLVKVTSNPQWVFVITGAIIVGFVWYATYELSALPWLSILLFFISRQYFISLNVVRQYTGLAIVCIGLVFLKKKKYWGYVVCSLLGTMCHYSVAIFIPLLILAFIRLKPIDGIIVIGIVSIFNTPIREITRWVVSFTPYEHYLDSSYDLAARYQSWTIFEMIFVFALISLLLERNPLREDEHIIQFLYNLEIVCVMFSFNLNFVPNSDRISWSLELPSVFLIPLVLDRCESKRDKILIIAAICLVYSYVMYHRIFILNDHETVPYQLIPSLSILFVGK